VFERIKVARLERQQAQAVTRFAQDCRKLLSERGDAIGVALAATALEHYAQLDDESKSTVFQLLADEFDPDPGEVLILAERYAVNRSPANLVALSRAAEPPRQELLRRLNRAPGGAGAIVKMRSDLLTRLKAKPKLQAVDADFQHLLSSWFNPGFLQMQRIDWNSPARLLEQLIAHEAVHEIQGWDDLRRRLEPDRRCFAFFHPMLPQEPLIFVEVALLDAMPSQIGPLIDPASPKADPNKAKVAVFYSISNCQPGLRGVSLGNFLIKRVAQELQNEFSKIKTFCTLSPIPDFANWYGQLQKQLKVTGPTDSTLRLSELASKKSNLALCDAILTNASAPKIIEQACAYYLGHSAPLIEVEGLTAQQLQVIPSDPVARFHLNNGARLERINLNGDLSKKGQRQALGCMVNYLYDLDQIENNHDKFVNGQVVASRSVRGLL
jgi:malonyl-CoA decarboxylase